MNDVNKDLFGKRLNKSRKEKHMTSDELGDKCGVNSVFIRNIERAARSPSMKVLVKMCNALKLSPNYLLFDSLDDDIQNQIIKPGQFDRLIDKISLLTEKDIAFVEKTVDMLLDKMDTEP